MRVPPLIIGVAASIAIFGVVKAAKPYFPPYKGVRYNVEGIISSVGPQEEGNYHISLDEIVIPGMLNKLHGKKVDMVFSDERFNLDCVVDSYGDVGEEVKLRATYEGNSQFNVELVQDGSWAELCYKKSLDFSYQKSMGVT